MSDQHRKEKDNPKKIPPTPISRRSTDKPSKVQKPINERERRRSLSRTLEEADNNYQKKRGHSEKTPDPETVEDKKGVEISEAIMPDPEDPKVTKLAKKLGSLDLEEKPIKPVPNKVVKPPSKPVKLASSSGLANQSTGQTEEEKRKRIREKQGSEVSKKNKSGKGEL